MMIYGYIRVSTEQQNTINQKHEISTFADKNGLKIDKWVDDPQASEGTQAWKSDEKVEKREHSHCQRIKQAWQKSDGSDGNPSKMPGERMSGVDSQGELPTWCGYSEQSFGFRFFTR